MAEPAAETPASASKAEPKWTWTPFGVTGGIIGVVVSVWPPEGVLWRPAAYQVVIPATVLIAFLLQPAVHRRLRELHAQMGTKAWALGVVAVAILWVWAILFLGNLPPEAKQMVSRAVAPAMGQARDVTLVVVDGDGALPPAGPLPPPTPTVAEQFAVLREQVALLQDQIRRQAQTQANPPSPGRPAQPAASATPPEIPAPRRELPPLPAVTLTLTPADTACSQIGVVAYEGRDGSEQQLLTELPGVKRDYQEVMRRIVAAGTGRNMDAERNAVRTLNQWIANREGTVNTAYGPVAALDLRNTPGSDAALQQMGDVTLADDATKTAIRRSTAYLECWLAIEANIRKRRP